MGATAHRRRLHEQHFGGSGEARTGRDARARYEQSRHVPGVNVTVWEWRKTPNVGAKAPTQGRRPVGGRP